ncbi:MAG: Lsr2 family protein [Nocardioides sp.]|uniref:ERCC4 domain-containing protein n=1 Tax=Nocardioides sp. TaxID=35761 RepID=UPI00239092A0|nr:histone-like nucleoid-structuring protein Lsr2 [Nocardioides sp.]MDE0777870.1 Lsr2 family protein [Nocardioides sp.]
MPDDFVIARNPDGDSTLPYVLRIPLGEHGIVLKSRETWPRTSKVYCHRVEEWPEDAEVLERVPVRSCIRRGAAIDLVLDRGRENRSQLVMTRVRGGRQAIFWQTARTAKQARPAVAVPKARASGVVGLEIVVDSHERYAYGFADQQVVTRKAGLAAGDYGLVRDGSLIASVERKSLVDLVSSLTTGKLKYQLADLAAVPRAAVVVEDRYSEVFKLDRVRPAVVLDGLAECQVRWPQVPIHFCETRKLAAEWTYRFLAAATVAAEEDELGEAVVSDLASPPPLAAAPATPAEVRAWAAVNGYQVSDRGRVRREVVEAFEAARSR